MPIRPTFVRILILCAAATAACGGPSRAPAPQGLAYGRPDPDPATYTFSDTTELTIEAGMGPMAVVRARAGTAELDFRRWDSEARVLVRFLRLRASFRNPGRDGVRVGESDIGGPFGVRVDGSGVVAVVDTPTLGAGVLDIAGPESLVRPLFAFLPGRPVDIGAEWVDTVTTVETVAGTRSEVRSVVTSVLEDEVVTEGRRLLRIRTTTRRSVALTGVSGGVTVDQRLSGVLTGWVLWDAAARVMVERVESGELAGTLEMPGTAAPAMAVRARIYRVASLRP